MPPGKITGIDIAELTKVRRLIGYGVPRLRRVFTTRELDSGSPGSPRVERLACACALKEAVFKALDRG
ncbi:MAG: 4'-phosphopantetheinyl transferase superfamily protein [Candidatus Aureabacteria bacterium]|nr:4'-phosphopantetheinyl transferase superfamily protein [Candidatus Auribacterota bacterium]